MARSTRPPDRLLPEASGQTFYGAGPSGAKASRPVTLLASDNFGPPVRSTTLRGDAPATKFEPVVSLAEAISAVGAMVGRRGKPLGVAVAIVSAVIAMPSLTGPAAADQVGDAQAQASRLATQIALGAARIHQLTGQYGQASDRASAAATQLAHAVADIQRTQLQVDRSRALLRVDAVNAYVSNDNGSAGLATGSSRPTTGNPATDALVGREYLAVASGDMADTIDQLRSGLQTLRVDESTRGDSQRISVAAADKAALARQAALAEAAGDQATLAQVQGRLVQLVAEADAARAAAAARARAAAEVATPAPLTGTSPVMPS